jgi:hypothetical protein
MLQTERAWRIRDLNATSVRPFPLVQAELAAQIESLRGFADELDSRVARIVMVSGHLTVLDTHVLLHYQPPEQVNWQALVGQAAVRLVIPLRVIEELDEKKYTARSNLAERARRLLSQLRVVMAPGGAPGRLRDGVTVEVPLEGGGRARSADADQEVLDTCRELALVSGQPVTLVTADTGMTLRAEAQGIRVIAPPEELLRSPTSQP